MSFRPEIRLSGALMLAGLAALLLASPTISCLAAPASPMPFSPAWPAIAPRFKPATLQILERRTAKPLNNIGGDIAWGVSYEMDAFLEMFRATGDRFYLDSFVKLADAVVAARADARGERDWMGRVPAGWLTGGYYTLGVPFDLLDENGQKSLQIETMAASGNNFSSIEIAPAPDGASFSLQLTNAFRKSTPEVHKFDALTMENVEARLNDGYGRGKNLRVKRLGDAVPRAYAPFTPPTARAVLHGHHTGRIVSPLAQFAALVKKDAKLSAYRPQAAIYERCAASAVADMESLWRDEGDHGYLIFEKGVPFWSDGVPEPLNVQASSGSAYLNLFDATGNPFYLERATKLARLIRRNFEAQPDGTWLYRYWFGIVRTGWKPEQDISYNTPFYAGQTTIEDTSHFQLSMRFVAECHERGLVFTRGDMEKWAATFRQKILQTTPGGSFTLADNVAGEHKKAAGVYDYAVAGFALLDAVDPQVARNCRALYEARWTPISTNSVALYSWGVLARIEAERTRNLAR